MTIVTETPNKFLDWLYRFVRTGWNDPWVKVSARIAFAAAVATAFFATDWFRFVAPVLFALYLCILVYRTNRNK